MKQITETFKYDGIERAVIYSVPENTDKAILDFHGDGEMSTTSDPLVSSRQLTARSGLPFLIKNGFEIDYLVISPQSWGKTWDMNFAKAVYEDAKKRFGFKHCFGVGISRGGKIETYAETFPNDLIATVNFAGVKGYHPSKRTKVPDWTIVGSTDSVVNPYSNSLPYIKSLNEAGGNGYYTLFKGVGHGARLWNDALDGSISVDQLEANGFTGKKEYKQSHFPIGDWFNSFLEETRPVGPVKSGLVKPLNILGVGIGNAESIFNVSDGYNLSVETPEDLFKNSYEDHLRQIIADYGSVLYFSKVEWLDLHGKGNWALYASKDLENWETVLVDSLNSYRTWKKKDINIDARYLKIETYEHQLPVRVALTASGEQPIIKTYDLYITGATESEKNEIVKMVGEKATVKENDGEG